MSTAEDKKEDSRALAEEMANIILIAAGSGLRHYMPSTKEAIINIAERWVVRLSNTKLAP